MKIAAFLVTIMMTQADARAADWHPKAYAVLAASIAADGVSTSILLNRGGSEANPLLRCSPPRPGCFSRTKFVAINAAPLAALIISDWRAPRDAPSGRARLRRIIVGVVSSMHFGLAVSNSVQAARIGQ